MKSDNNELQDLLSNMEVQNQNNADQNENLIKKIKEIDQDNIILKENLKNYEGSLNEEKKKNSENIDKIREIESFSKSIVNMVRTLGISLNMKNNNAPLRSFRAKNEEDQSKKKLKKIFPCYFI